MKRVEFLKKLTSGDCNYDKNMHLRNFRQTKHKLLDIMLFAKKWKWWKFMCDVRCEGVVVGDDVATPYVLHSLEVEENGSVIHPWALVLGDSKEHFPHFFFQSTKGHSILVESRGKLRHYHISLCVFVSRWWSKRHHDMPTLKYFFSHMHMACCQTVSC